MATTRIPGPGQGSVFSKKNFCHFFGQPVFKSWANVFLEYHINIWQVLLIAENKIVRSDPEEKFKFQRNIRRCLSLCSAIAGWEKLQLAKYFLHCSDGNNGGDISSQVNRKSFRKTFCNRHNSRLSASLMSSSKDEIREKRNYNS